MSGSGIGIAMDAEDMEGPAESRLEHEPCPDCAGTGYYGDNGPGVEGNTAYVRCECAARGTKCNIGYHAYRLVSGLPWCDTCNLEADITICRESHALPAERGCPDCAKLRARLAELEGALADFGSHQRGCVLDRWQAGRPTEDGGYETKYAGKWYPKGEDPPCTCGFHAALAASNGEG